MTNERDIEKEREELRRLRDQQFSNPAEDALSDPRVQRRLCEFIAKVILAANERIAVCGTARGHKRPVY